MEKYISAIFLCFLGLFLCSTTSLAQEKKPLITQESYCMILHNDTGYTVYGSIGTDYYIGPDGSKARHLTNLKLAKDERQQICSNGPFYEGYKLELNIRTLFPVFSCKTSLGGEVRIYTKKREDGSGRDYFADCLE